MQDFIANLAEQFEETEVEQLQPSTVFQDLEDWSSMTSMAIIAMAKIEYGKTITGKEIRQCATVSDLYDLIMSK